MTAERGRTDIKAVVVALAGQAESLAAELLPAGRREWPYWRAGSTAPGDAGRSLTVWLSGEKKGEWFDYAAGEGGDMLDLVAACLFAGNKGEALRWAVERLGAGFVAPAPRRAAERPVRDKSATLSEEEARIRRRAKAIWLDGGPIAGTPAERYLAGRGIDLGRLGRLPAALRYSSDVWHKELGRGAPALLAAVMGPDGQFVAVHRTWLAATGGRVTKAPLKNAKMTLGRLAGGAIPLWRGATARPLREAAAGSAVALTEGIEDGLTVALARPDLRVLCAVSLANLANVALPPAIAEVILVADNDGDNDKAKAFLERAIRAHQAAGRAVRLALPPEGVKDVNELLQVPS